MTYNVMAINPGHNGSAALTIDGELVYYIEEERLSRYKYDGNPFRAMMDIMFKWRIDELIIGGTSSQFSSLPWTAENPYSALVRKYFPNIKVTNIGDEHHFGHAACSFYNSGFDKAICIVVDGAGSYKQEQIGEGYETESTWVFEYPSNYKLVNKVYGSNNHRKVSDDYVDIDDAVTITKAYEAVSSYLGFGYIEAGKTMGLSSYGKKDENIPQLFYGNRANKNVFIPRYPAGAAIDEYRNPYLIRTDSHIEIEIDMLRSNKREWHKDPSKLTDVEKNLAWQIQEDTQRLVGDMIQSAIEKTGIKNVCISGGYGLNCVANYYYKKRFPEINLYCEPASHDGGTAIGLAKWGWYRTQQHVPSDSVKKYPQTTLYHGPIYSPEQYDYEISQYLNDIEVTKDVTPKQVAEIIADRNIVALYQGGSEAGPRALGNRSILYDPTDPNGKDFVNTVKGREWFRPFAGSILKEHAHEYFDMAGLEESPFMMYAVDVLPEKCDKIAAITHVDNTCRIQTVTEEQNKHYYNLIKEFGNITGVPILFNTSYNLAGEPLVETMGDALSTIFKSKIRYLYIPEYGVLIKKKADI